MALIVGAYNGVKDKIFPSEEVKELRSQMDHPSGYEISMHDDSSGGREKSSKQSSFGRVEKRSLTKCVANER